MPLGAERRLQLHRKGIGGLQAIARGEAVAQRKERDLARGSRIHHEDEKGEESEKFRHVRQLSAMVVRFKNRSATPGVRDSMFDSTITTAVSLKDVHLSLPSRAGTVDILRGVDLTVKSGEALGIVGPSGSGKTTLLMVIAGLERASRGEVTVAGHSLTGKGEDELAAFRRDHVGIVFQSFHLIPTMTARENVAVPLEFRGTPDALAIAEDRLKRVGLGHRLDHYPGQLSGGEQQRVAIARALASGAKIIIADEPTGNLDHVTGEQIIRLLFELKTQDGASLILVTHDRALAQRCDRVAEVLDGRIVSGAEP